MLQVNYIIENKEKVIEGLKKKKFETINIVEDILLIDKKRRELKTELDNLLSSINSISREIGELYKSGERERAEILKKRSIEFKEKEKLLSEDYR